ncbi:XRE family transcriptional regulator [Actinomadura graeca]|uniref:XRE family transcriptional regulator n=1 Tax=Actinomadura graeca TaxID=2750812 RepID=A0ABX8QTM9_9ACTN|nr:helix-turn-helix transcriptional regulator [Actinomadura graeca]QXJ22169.1 XRE family transcriptional regulator [Actinomadura graeca]
MKGELRRLKAWSGLSYRELERRAQSTGHPLPHTTIAAMLSASRPRLPRDEQIEAFTRACGCDDEQVAAWVAARRRIAMEDAVPEQVQVPPQESDGLSSPGLRRRPLLIIGGLCAVTVAVLLAVAVGDRFSRGSSGKSLSPGASASVQAGRTGSTGPGPGRYRIRAAHSGMCLSEVPSASSGLVTQTSCARSFPPMELERRPGGYRILTHHPEFGLGCMGISEGRKTPGPYVFDDQCGDENAGGEVFSFEPVGGAAPGFTIRAVHSGFCLGFPEDTKRDRAPLFHMPCDGSAGQVFVLVPG